MNQPKIKYRYNINNKKVCLYNSKHKLFLGQEKHKRNCQRNYLMKKEFLII